MADSPSSSAMSDEVFTVLAQIYGAFAQGAGHLFFDDGVILAAREDYVPFITRDLARWPTDGPLVLSLTRAMGQFAAHIALGEGRITIGVDDYRESRRRMLVVRPFCPFHHDRPPLA